MIMAECASYELKGNGIETAIWSCIPLLGPNWLGKWAFSAEGFQIIVTDGVFIWGQEQAASYVTEKAKEWAICIEGDIASLSREILHQLKCQAGVLTCKKEGLSLLQIELAASLEGLPYRWMFNLKLLSPDMVHYHWTFPIVTSLKFMESRVHKLENELKRRERQLIDLDPKYQPSSESSSSIPSLMSSCTEATLDMGLAKAFCENPCFAPCLMKAFYQSNNKVASPMSVADQKVNSQLNNDVETMETAVTNTDNPEINDQKRLSSEQEVTMQYTNTKKKQKRKIRI